MQSLIESALPELLVVVVSTCSSPSRSARSLFVLTHFSEALLRAPASVTRTMRNRAFAAIIRSYASRALDRGMTSIIGSTFSSRENSTVSCSSCTLPVVDPEMECMPKMREPVLTSRGSGAIPITNSFPLTARPFTRPDIYHLEPWQGWHRLRQALVDWLPHLSLRCRCT